MVCPQLAQLLPMEENFLLLFRFDNPLESSVEFMKVSEVVEGNPSGGPLGGREGRGRVGIPGEWWEGGKPRGIEGREGSGWYLRGGVGGREPLGWREGRGRVGTPGEVGGREPLGGGGMGGVGLVPQGREL